MLRGGYQIIDLQNKELTLNVGMLYDGIYDKLDSTRKAILLSGLNVGGIEYKDAFIEPLKDNNSYTITIYDYVVTIENTDVVTVVLPQE